MSKLTKTIAALGVVAGLGVAALPLSTYAALPTTGTGQQAQAEVQAVIDSAISISSDYNGDTEKPLIELGEIAPGQMTAEMTDALKITVTSNAASAPYDLYIHTTSADGSMVGTNADNKIPGGVPALNTSAWGYAFSSNNSTFSAYKAVPTLANATKVQTAQFNTGTTSSNDSYFRFKVSASNVQASDTYKATVVFTAMTN